jgi:hypothetical protein
LNESYADMGRHYGVALMPARPYRPQDKSHVELGVKGCQRWILVNFTPMFPVISLLCFHPFHKHVSTYFTRSFHLETVRETNRSFPLAV